MSAALEFLGVPEIAEALHLSRQSVRAMFASGRLPGVKLGRTYRVLRSTFEAHIKLLEQGGPPVRVAKTRRTTASREWTRAELNAITRVDR